jgi:hypothetical protein
MKFLVEVFWSSKSGNPCRRTSRVEAKTAAEAWKMVADKVKQYVRFDKLLGGNARPANGKVANVSK